MSERPRGIPMFEMKRPLRVHAMRVLLTIGFQEDRPELRALATLAAQRGGRLDVAMVQQALLPTLPKVVARRFLEGAKCCGLFESVERDRFVLTELGVRAQTEHVFVPQEGLWTIWVTDDPLVPPERRVLRLDACVRPRGEREEKPSKIAAGVIDALRPEALAAWARGLGRFRVTLDQEHTPAECVTIQTRSRVTLTLRVSTGGEVELALDGVIEGDDLEHDEARSSSTRFHHPTLGADEVWRTALGANVGAWEHGRLATAFDELDDDARRSFRRSMRISSWRHSVLGTFGPFDVAAVPLCARAQSDADAWARWLLERRIDAYATADAWVRWTESVRAELPEFPVRVPTQRELAKSLHRGGRAPDPVVYWHLVAPLDLQLDEGSAP